MVLARTGVRRRLSDAAELLGVVFRVAVGCGVVRRVRDECERRVAGGLGGRKLLLGRLERRFDGAQRFELLRRGLALELRLAAELVDLGNEGAPALVRCEERVEVLRGAFAGELGAPTLRVGPCGLEVDHARESKEPYEPATDET